MSRKRHLLRSYLGAISVAYAAGCAAEEAADESESDLAPASVSQQIASEVPGRADIAARVRMGNPDRLLASYATVKQKNIDVPGEPGTGECSGTMIGPNVMLTASHCGSAPTTRVTFFNYTDTTLNGFAKVKEDFICDRLASTWYETDVSLWWCPPNGVGESPGDKYGYLDFDLVFNTSNNEVNLEASRAKVTAGAQVYSFWNNLVNNLGGTAENQDHMIFGTGTITSTTSPIWSNPSPLDWSATNLGQCDFETSPDLAIGVTANIYSNPGCSGSAMISRVVGVPGGRILAAPISTSSVEANGRDTHAAVDMLSRAVLQTPDAVACGGPANWRPMVNGTLLAWRGIGSAGFRNVLDADNDGVIDVQEAMETNEKEHRRPAYWFGFDSARSNQRWSDTFGLSVARTNRSALVMNAGTGTQLFPQIFHAGVNLLPNTNYHLSFTAASNRQVRICLGGQTNCTTVGPTPGGTSTYTRYSAMLNSGVGGIFVYTIGAGTSTVGEISLTQQGSVADFNSMDARALWTSPVSRVSGTNTPTFLPLGRRSDSGFFPGDMAMVVSRGLYSHSSVHLPFSSGNTRVCFDARNNPLDRSNWGSARVRVLNGSGQVTSLAFAPPTNWGRFCTPWFNMPSTSGTLDLGLDASGITITPGSWLIDNIALDRDAAPTMRFAFDGRPPEMPFCTQIAESADAAGTWLDNWLCTDRDIGLRWSSAGPISNMRCTQITEPSEPASTTWTDNWLCVPTNSPVNLEWSYAGPREGKTCVKWWEPADPHTWADNYLCY